MATKTVIVSSVGTKKKPRLLKENRLKIAVESASTTPNARAVHLPRPKSAETLPRKSGKSTSRAIQKKSTRKSAESILERKGDARTPGKRLSIEEELLRVREAQAAIMRNPGPPLGSGASLYKQLSSTVTGPSLISQHILIGNKDDAADIDGLHKLGVTHVLNVATQQTPNFYPKDFVYTNISIFDKPDENLNQHKKTAVEFLQRVEKMKGRVLVHCIAGVSRSVSFVIMHLMVTHQMFLRVAYDHVKSIRPYILPNNGFLLQLAKLETELFGLTSVASAPEWNFYEWNSIKHKTKKFEPVTASSGGFGCFIL